MKSIRDFQIWSNFLFVIPLTLTLHNHLVWYSLIIFGAMLTSVWYHTRENQWLKSLDIIFALTLIVTNLYYAWLGNFQMPYFFLALLTVPVSFVFKIIRTKDERGFALTHGFWHVASMLITVFCLLTYSFG